MRQQFLCQNTVSNNILKCFGIFLHKDSKPGPTVCTASSELLSIKHKIGPISN